MAQNPFRVNGLGLIKAYSSDSNYVSSTGTALQRGDIYFNSSENIFRFYDGTKWNPILSKRSRAIVKAYDQAFTSVPSGLQTVDGIFLTAGDLVLMDSTPVKGIYKVSLGAWELQTDQLQDSSGSPIDGDSVWVKDGTSWSESELYYTGTMWITLSLSPGSTVNSIIRWDGSNWVENINVTISSSGVADGITSVQPLPNSVNSNSQAQSLSISGGDKTNGTGNGGDVLISGGSSVGGSTGKVQVTASKISLNAPSSSDPVSANQMDVYYNTSENRFKYYNGSQWLPLGSGNGAYPVNYINTTLTSLPSVSPFLPDGTAVVTNDEVLFTNLISPIDRGVWKAAVSGLTLTWSRVMYGRNSTGQSQDGDFVWVKSGSTQSNNLFVCTDTASAVWTDYENTLSNNFASRSLSNLISTAINADLLPSSDNSKKLGSSAVAWSDVHTRQMSLHGATSGEAQLKAADSTSTYSVKLPPVAPLVGQIMKAITPTDLDWANATTPGDLIKVRVYDPNSVILPIGNPVVIDGVTLQANDLVLFSNLAANDNKIYKAIGTGSNITSWIPQVIFGVSSTPSDSDRVAILEGDGFADQIASFSGSEWFINNKVRYFNGGDYFEQSSINTINIANNTTGNVFVINRAGSENMIVEYSIKRGTVKESGRILVTTDGLTVAVTGDSAYTGISGVTFSGDLDLPSVGNLRLKYTSDNGSVGTMKFNVRRWSDTAGGPGNIPSYSLPVTDLTGSGSNGQISFWNGPTSLTGSDLFKVNTSTQAIEMNGLEQVVLQEATLLDGQLVGGNAFSFPDSYKHAVIEYGIQRGSNYRTGRLLISQDGSNGSLSDDFVEQGNTGIVLAVDVSLGLVYVKYFSTNTGQAAQIRYSYRRW